MLKTFFLSFIPLFVAIDPIGIIPLFLSLTESMEAKQKRSLVTDATLTAAAISLIFLIGGHYIFQFLGITENDFRVGGGIVLLVLAVYDLIFSHENRRAPDATVGVVPIGIPLIMGPAALTTILIEVQSYGYITTIIALLMNMLVVWSIFRYADLLSRLMGRAGSRAFAKVASLFMAGIAIMMIRIGLEGMMHAIRR